MNIKKPFLSKSTSSIGEIHYYLGLEDEAKIRKYWVATITLVNGLSVLIKF